MNKHTRSRLGDLLSPPEGTSLGDYICIRGLRWFGRKLGDQRDRSTPGVATTDQTLTRSDPAIDIRIYEPNPFSGLRPATVFLHGGGWISGNLDTNQRLCSLLAEESGHIVISVEYRLAPEHRFPAAVNDCVHVLEWIAAEGPTHGIDPEAVEMFGTSAGGTLAAALHADPPNDLPLSVAHQTLVYPLLDPGFDDRQSNTRVLRRIARPLIQKLWNLYLTPDTDRTKPRVAPLRTTCFDAVPPTTIVTCGLDPLQAEGQAYVQTLAASDVPVAHVEFPRFPHGFLTFLPRVSRWRTLAVLRRIQERTSELND